MIIISRVVLKYTFYLKGMSNISKWYMMKMILFSKWLWLSFWEAPVSIFRTRKIETRPRACPRERRQGIVRKVSKRKWEKRTWFYVKKSMGVLCLAIIFVWYMTKFWYDILIWFMIHILKWYINYLFEIHFEIDCRCLVWKDDLLFDMILTDSYKSNQRYIKWMYPNLQ